MIRAIRAVLVLVLLIAGVGALVVWKRPDLVPFLSRSRAPEAVVESQELADSTLDRFEAFQRGDLGDELRLGGAQISSVVRYSFPGLLPAGMHEPSVELREDRVHLSAKLEVATLPDIPALRDVRGLLPDTVQLAIEGTVSSYGREQVLVRIQGMEAAGIPLPARLYPEILKALGRETPPDLPAGSLLVPLPSGFDSISVARDTLVLFSAHPTPH